MSKNAILPAMRAITRRLPTSRQPAASKARPPLPGPRVQAPVRDPSPEAETRRALIERGRFLARQEAWDALGQEITGADRDRALTKGLHPVAMLLAQGARSDATAAARAAVRKGEPRSVRSIVSALESNLDDSGECPAFAFVVAMTHVDLAAAWRGGARLRDLPPQPRDMHDRHLLAAAELADRYDPFEQDSALWAAVRCAVLEADPAPAQRVADDYEDLIDLAPGVPDHMCALGRDLLPRRFGSYEALDLQARRTALRQADLWGAGGYAWVFLGALEQDLGAFRRLDAEFFCEGLHDILDRHPNQHLINRLAAFTALSLSGPAPDDSVQGRVRDAFGWIVQDHLRELHPVIWATAPMPGRGARVELEDEDLSARGVARALLAIAEHFGPQLADGEKVVIGPEGFAFKPGH